LQNFQHTVAVNEFAAASVCFENRKDDVLFARAGEIFQAHFRGDFHQFGYRLEFECRQIHRLARCGQFRGGNYSDVIAVRKFFLRQLVVLVPRTAIAVVIAAMLPTAAAFIAAAAALIARLIA
jgi:hypothetical protein